MWLRIEAVLVAALAMAAAPGCQEPKEIVPVVPPGFDLARIPATPQGDGAQALGEQAGQIMAANQNKVQINPNGLPATPVGQLIKTLDGLGYMTLKEGNGAVAKSGDKVEIHYTGTLADGTKFDSSVDRGKPFETQIGLGHVIAGWDEGVPGMKVGEKRKLIIPPALAYGDRGQDKIPPNSTLTFEVELLSIK